MARLRLGQRVDRVLRFMLGLQDARAVRVLARHGFDQAEYDRGWQLLRARSDARGHQ